MSADEAVSAAIDPNSVGARAADWIQRRNFWHWTEANQAELDSWLAEALSHRVAYWRLNAAFNRAERLVVLRAPTADSSVASTPRRVRPSLIGAVAALLVCALLGAGGAVFLAGAPEKVYATALGERETITLADGSQIELNTDTVVRVSASAGRRIVSLEKGEAYFQIKHDAARPFVVVAGGRRLTDVGTKFLVRRDAGNLAVAVVEGRIRFETPSDKTRSPALLVSGDTVLATTTAISVTKKSPQKLMDALGWRHGVLVFQHTTLADAADEFNRYNTKKLVIVDTKTAALQINGTFRSNDAEAFTVAARDVFGLRVENRGADFVISR